MCLPGNCATIANTKTKCVQNANRLARARHAIAKGILSLTGLVVLGSILSAPLNRKSAQGVPAACDIQPIL